MYTDTWYEYEGIFVVGNLLIFFLLLFFLQENDKKTYKIQRRNGRDKAMQLIGRNETIHAMSIKNI